MQVRRRARCGCGRSGHVVGSGWLVGVLLFPFTFIDSGHYMYVSSKRFGKSLDSDLAEPKLKVCYINVLSNVGNRSKPGPC